MSFLPPEPSTFINIKLTDVGRRQLSLGDLKFSTAVLSDREIDYSIDRTGVYDITMNRVLAPKDDNPYFATNLDGTVPIELSAKQVTSAKQFTTATTVTAGFFTGTTGAFGVDDTKYKGKRILSYSGSTPNGSNLITLSAGSYTPLAGDLMYIGWQPIQNSGYTYVANNTLSSGNPVNSLWYRVTAVTSPTAIILDRPVPNFGTTVSSSQQKLNAYFYPYNGVETYYGSAATVDVKLWNMNIVRTFSVLGTDITMSGYTNYSSIEFNGTKHYLGFSAETPALGIIHYTNEYTGNTYAEQLIEGTVKLTIPNIMWHNISGDNGLTKEYGATFYDVDGDSYFDNLSQTTYKDLKDGTSSNAKIVGRVYHRLRIVIITDQELLTALTYKSNRSFTLPESIVNLTSSPKYPLSSSEATGLCKSGYTYFVTYIAESNPIYTSGVTFGYPDCLPCGYVQKINGSTDINGNNQFLSVSFPTNSFPYLRNSVNMGANSSFSGTGWNANKIQILVSEQLTTYGYDIGSVPANSWKRVSSVVRNGIYTGDTTDLTIEPLKLNGFNFIISNEDYVSGTTYNLGSDFLAGTDSLFFGDEAMFFANFDADILATTYKSVITVFAKNDQFNTSVNTSFSSTLDTNTYITEIGILDDENNLVAVGKPTYPITKNNGRYLAFQLEMDF